MSILETERVDAIGKDGNILRLAIFDSLDWDYEDMHLDLLQEKLNNYLTFLIDKQYVQNYGDDFEEKAIDIYFQNQVTSNSIKLINVFSSIAEDEGIVINLHLPSQ